MPMLPAMASSAEQQPVRRKSSLSIQDTRMAGLYDLEHTIGQGHFAVVKLARHVFTGEKVAVKVVDKTKLDPVSTAHMMQEVRCMKLVQHPNIVRLYEVIDTQTKLFLILELGDYDMYEFIMRRNDKGCSEDEAQRYFCQIIKAIDYCHTLHVVHRDLKPENVVFFEKIGMVKLTDFGFSNLFTPGQQLETSCGSLAYSAPEILLGDAYDAPAVDVWSLGVILYMLICGRLPFQEANDSETLTKILDCKFSLPDYISDDCKRLISRMLVREPSKRSTLSEILKSKWIRAGDFGHAERLPLICREQLPESAHTTIIEQMIAGGIGSEEQIHSAIETDDYSYITATYYLLAERVLSKQREEQAQRLLTSGAIDHEEYEDDTPTTSATIAMESEDSVGELPCTSGGTPTTLNNSAGSAALSTPAGSTAAAAGAMRSRSRSNSWRRHRPCSILKEESEEELGQYLKTSRQSSRNSSPSVSMFYASTSGKERVSPQAIQELLDLSSSASRTHSGRRSPETSSRRSSRSPSPGGSSSGGRTSPSILALAGRLKSVVGASGTGALRKLSSSPHLLNIYEEGEELLDGTGSPARQGVGRSGSDIVNAENSTGLPLAKRSFGPPPSTYSSVRKIRPRHAVVSPDVIRRYERKFGSRSRRSTSCSSSEASDDDSERRYNLIGSKYCGNRPPEDGDDDEPPLGGGGTRGSRRRHHSANLPPHSEAAEHENGGESEEQDKLQDRSRDQRATTADSLDACKLIGKLQKLVLHPIREMPSGAAFMAGLVGRSGIATRIGEWWSRAGWVQRLRKPKSCEDVFLSPKCPMGNDLHSVVPQVVQADSGVSSTASPDRELSDNESVFSPPPPATYDDAVACGDGSGDYDGGEGAVLCKGHSWDHRAGNSSGNESLDDGNHVKALYHHTHHAKKTKRALELLHMQAMNNCTISSSRVRMTE